MKDILKMMRFDFISAQDAANKTATNAFAAIGIVVTIGAAILFLFRVSRSRQQVLPERS